MKNRTTHYFKPMLCGAWGCVRASVLAFLKQGSSLQQYLIAVVVETAEVYAKMAHNKAGYEGFIRKRHEKDSWCKGRNIEYGGEAEADFMPEAEYQEQL